METVGQLDGDTVHLETILREYRDAVVACDQNARILLYNAAANRLFHEYEALGLGQSLYKICARTPIEHTLRMLRHGGGASGSPNPEGAGARFVCATVDDKMLLTCHLSRMRTGKGQEFVYVFTFEDTTRQITEAGRQGYLLNKMIKELRSPLTNLNTAVDNLKAYPDMTPAMRSSFEDIIAWESRMLTKRFSAIAQESEKIANLQWPLFDLYSADLIGCVSRRLREEDRIKITMTGVPLWLHGDSYSLVLLLHRLVILVRDLCSVAEAEIEALLGDRRVFIDIAWRGEPLPQAKMEELLAEPLADSAGMTIADVLARHDSEIWSQKHRRQGDALLRIPLPDSPRQWQVPPSPPPVRQEFYDFSIARREVDLGDKENSPLASLTYVVFDTETTGLRLAAGDEILAIAAVRIVNGRILSGERFERLIRPQRPIPESALPFLAVNEELLRDEPQLQVVLPKFKDFVDDAVLVAHNGAFDLHFFQSMEGMSGVKFANPVLDTLLLAAVVDRERTDHTLAGIGRSLDLEVMTNKTTMADCFATAQIFLHLLDRLAGMGITTLGQAIAASEAAAAKRQQAG